MAKRTGKPPAAKATTRHAPAGSVVLPTEMDRHLWTLDKRVRVTVADLKAAQRDMKKYARRLAAANTTLSRRRQVLQSKIHLRERQLSEKVKRLSILYEVGGVMSTTLELDHLLELIVKLAARHLKARKASLMLLDKAGSTMRINSAVGIRKWIVEKTRITVGQGIAGKVAGTGEAILIEDIATDKRFKRPSRGTYRTGSFLSVPLKRQEKILGVLNVSDKRSREAFDTDDFNLVTTLAAEAAIAVENATLYQNLKEKIVSLEELYRLREGERRQLLTLINSITDSILAVDLEGHPLFINAMAGNLLSLPEQSSDGRLMKDILPPGELGDSIMEGLESALSTVVTRREIILDQKGSERKYIELICLPVRESRGDLIGALAVVRDISEIKALDQARTDFLNRASHQLKTPVGLIKGFADTLVKHVDMDPARRRHFLELVHSESKRLDDLIENLLDFTQIEAKVLRVEKERVSLEDLLREILPAIEAKAAEKGIELAVSLKRDIPMLETDPGCLSEVVRNILDNCLKFTPRGGRIGVATEAEGNRAGLTISDTGPGIEESELPYIFEKFYVGHSSAAAGTGTGLGLYIAREMISALEGSITLTSRAGEGTMVRITLPAAGDGQGTTEAKR